jgi:hypothetical protein
LLGGRSVGKLTTTTITSNTTDFVTKLYTELSSNKIQSVKHGPVNVRPTNYNILVFDARKYYDLAINYRQYALLLVVAEKDEEIQPFKVSLSDVSTALKQKLVTLPSFELQYVLKEAVLKIFQDLDNVYNSVFEDKKSKQFHIHHAKMIAEILRVELMY